MIDADDGCSMADEIHDTDELPSVAGRLADEHPEVWDSYADLGEACSDAGPIDGDTKRLVKLALAVGAQSEGAVHSHVRRGLDEDIDPETLRHVGVLAIPTLGFPKSMAALSWIEDLADGE
jgi:alkylhydroperoxidase/carboxymuconolactone decarboxylase family protein YurZ